jgi:hypothetical protein
VIVKISEWRKMADIIRVAFLDMNNILRRPHLMSKKDPVIKNSSNFINTKADTLWKGLNEQINKKGLKVRRQDGRPEEVKASTQSSPPMEESRKRCGQWGSKVSANQSNKRKTTSPPEDRNSDREKRAMSQA